MKFIKKFKYFLLFLCITTFFIITSSFVSSAQTSIQNGTVPNQVNSDKLFYQTSDFWGKVTIALVGTSSGAFFGFLASEYKRRKETIQLSFKYSKESILQFKKYSNKAQNITINYADRSDITDLYLLSCDIENTSSKYITDEVIRFEIKDIDKHNLPEVFFEPKSDENKVEKLNDSLEKLGNQTILKYKIKKIGRGEEIHFRFIAAIRKEQRNSPDLDAYIDDKNSKVEYKKANNDQIFDEREHLTKLITILLLFFIFPPFLEIIPFFGQMASAFARFAILILILPQINFISQIIVELITNLSAKRESGNTITNITAGGNLTIKGENSNMTLTTGAESHMVQHTDYRPNQPPLKSAQILPEESNQSLLEEE